MKRRVTLTSLMSAAVRLLAGVALSLFAVGLLVHTEGLTPPQTPTQGRLEPVTVPQQALAVPAGDVGDFYLYQGRRIPLHRSEDALGVRFRPTLAREAVAATLQSLVPTASIQLPGEPGTQGVSIVVVPPQKAADATLLALSPQLQLDQARQALKASPTVEFVFPVFVNPQTGNRLGPGLPSVPGWLPSGGAPTGSDNGGCVNLANRERAETAPMLPILVASSYEVPARHMRMPGHVHRPNRGLCQEVLP